MHIHTNKLVTLLLIAVLLLPVAGSGQLPVCTQSGPIYKLGGQAGNNFIYTIKLSAPFSSTGNPSINSIIPPLGAEGLAVGPNLNSAIPAVTFYVVLSGRYFYYNGTTWVDTGHSAGTQYAINPTAGGGYIFNFDILTGNVWRYDGTGDAVVVTNISSSGCVFDLAADCTGNFYLLKTSQPQKFTKYNYGGTLINTYTVSGVPDVGYGSGLAIMGNNVYYYDTASMHGVITGNNVDFVKVSPFFLQSSDMASCPGILVHSPTVHAHACADQLPYNWNGHTYNTTGNYSLTYQGSSGCDSIVSLDLTVTSVPPPVVHSPIHYCRGIPAAPLTATGSGTIKWYTVPFGGAPGLTALIPSTATTGIADYYVSQEVDGCESPRVKISVETDDGPMLGPDQEIHICTNGMANLAGLYEIPGFSGAWTINGQSVPDPSSVNSSGHYQLAAIAANGCKDTVLVSLIMQPVVSTFAGNDSTVEFNFPFQLSGSGGVSYDWWPAGLLNNPNIANPVAILTTNTSFYLQVKDAFGCPGFDTVHFKVLKGPAIYVPTAFTPNADGLNDLFKLTAVGIERFFYVKVFNRFGELVFESHDLSKSWDGSYKSAKQSSGNFIWILKAIDRNGKVIQMKGNVLLLK